MGIVIRQSIKGTIVNYVGTFIGFLTTFFISTKYLTAEEIGLTRTLIDAALLLASIASLGILSSGVKFFPYFKSKDGKHNGFFFYSLVMVFFGILLTFSLTLLFQDVIKNYFGREAPLFVKYFYLIFPLSFFLTYQLVFEMYSNVLMRIVVPRFVREVLVRIMTVISILLYIFDFVTLDWFIYLLVFSYGIAVLIDLFYVARIGNISLKHNLRFIRKPLRRYIFQYTGFIFLSALGAGIVSRIDMFMIGANKGLTDSGIYSIAIYMAAVIEIPSRSLGSISMPLASEYLKNKNYSKVNHLLKRVCINQFLIGCLIFILLWINIDNIFFILPKGHIYSAGKMVVFFLGLARICDLIGGFSINILFISKHYYYTLFFILLLSGLTIVGNQLLIPVYGMNGAAFVAFCALFIYYALILLLAKRTIKAHPFSKNMLYIVCFSVLIILFNHFVTFISNPYFDIIIRSTLSGGLFIFLMYILNISEEFNTILNRFIQKGYTLLVKRKK